MRDRMRWRSALVSVAALTALACRNPAAPAARLNFSFVIALGDTASVEGQGLDVTFDQVVSDSRCPTGAVCIDAGKAVVRVSLSKPPLAKETRDLETTAAASEATYGTYRVRLVALDPYPAAGQAIPTSNYAAVLRITQP